MKINNRNWIMKKIFIFSALIGIHICTNAIATGWSAGDDWGACTVEDWDDYITSCKNSGNCTVIDYRPTFNGNLLDCDSSNFCIINGFNEPVSCIRYCEFIPDSLCNATLNRQLTKKKTFSVSQCSQTTTITYELCTLCTQSCSGCTSDTTWTSTGTAGIEKKVKRECQCGNCASDIEYRCRAGYYGSPTSATKGCTKCPNSEEGGAGTGEIGQTIPGATKITQCFIEKGMEVCDATGCFDYVDDCYYK